MRKLRVLLCERSTRNRKPVCENCRVRLWRISNRNLQDWRRRGEGTRQWCGKTTSCDANRRNIRIGWDSWRSCSRNGNININRNCNSWHHTTATKRNSLFSNLSKAGRKKKSKEKKHKECFTKNGSKRWLHYRRNIPMRSNRPLKNTENWSLPTTKKTVHRESWRHFWRQWWLKTPIHRPRFANTNKQW